MNEHKPKSFWKRPEGVTGVIFLLFIAIGGAALVSSSLGYIFSLLESTLGLVGFLVLLFTVVYMVLDSRTRTLASYMYKSLMRWITGLFINVEPIAILKNYVRHLKGNLRKMNRQIAQLRGQMHRLMEMIHNNKKEIEANLTQAHEARDTNQQAVMILKSRKAGRLRESNMRLEDLYKKMEILFRVLTKMYENSAIMAEDIEDQVTIKEQERKALLAGHNAMKSAMSIIRGDSDKKAMFDAALEAIADDVSQKVGEMEEFMALSDNFMKSIDLRNGIFEEEGLKMLEKWEKQGMSLLLGNEKDELISLANDEGAVLDLNQPVKQPEKVGRANQYDSFFE
jgi:TolA-binding protein